MFNLEQKKILVTGGNGFLGKKVVNQLKTIGAKQISITSSQDNDLTLADNCKKVVKDIDIIFHLAGKVGGIGLNREKPGELFFDNLMMGTLLINEARKAGIEKFIALGTICSYPKFAALPFSEKSIWDGYPEETNAPYGLAKKMLLVQSEAYRQQYDFNSIVVFPTNLYGPGDNFEPDSSHVIPALIKKISDAQKTKSDTITVWGDGTPTRDFLYVDDAAKGIILAAEKYNSPEPINLGSEQEISIKDLVSLIFKLMDLNGKIKWDTSKPNGQPRRCVNNERARNLLEFTPETTLENGLKNTIQWYKDQIDI